MANKTVYPYGTGGQLPSSIGIINDPFTGGVDKAWSAEQGKTINEKVVEMDVQDLDSLELVKAAINASTDKWLYDNTAYKGKYLPVEPGRSYLVKAASDRSTRYAFITEKATTNNSSVKYATGCSYMSVAAGTFDEATAPYDAKYMYILYLNNNTNRSPESVTDVTSKTDILTKRVDFIESQRINTNGIVVQENWYIASSGNWAKTVTNPMTFASILVPITPGEQYYLVAKNTNGIFALLTSSAKTAGSQAPFCSEYPKRIVVSPGNIFGFIAPDDAAFAYVCILTSGSSLDGYVAIHKTIDEQFSELETNGGVGGSSPFELGAVTNVANAIGNKLYPLTPNINENNVVLPETIQEANVQKRSRQYTDILWTPLKKVPYNTPASTNSYFPANTQVKGLPYSSAKEYDKMIGENVSIHTFMTAVNNPYSLLYTENISEDNSQSAWGRTYHGTNCATYFGTVCSQLTAVCTGSVVGYATSVHRWLASNYHLLVKLNDQTAQSVRIGDVIWQSGHARLIHSVKKDENGIVTHVQLAESTFNHCIRNAYMTAEEFNNEIKTVPCILYRPLWLYRNINYKPSPYVPVGDENPDPVVYNDDICTFAGDKACFREGDIIAINYNLKQVGTWTAMELYKGTTLLDTITIDTSEHVVDLTARNLTYGKYKARMTDGTNYSDYTEWEILQTGVTATDNEGKTNLTITSANGKHISVGVCTISGSTRCQVEFTDEQVNSNSFDIDLVTLAKEQLNLNMRGLSGCYLKVYFQGEFGRVTNEPIPITFN